MTCITIYHNPSCSKSREVLAYLESRGYQLCIVLYLENPPSTAEIRALIKQLGVAPSSLIRTADFDRLGLQRTDDLAQLINLLVEHPILLQRPIVVANDRALIARSVDALKGWLPDPD